MLKVKTSGGFSKTETFLKANSNKDYSSLLHKYGQMGVDMLKAATPIDTGVTSTSWSYKIVETKTGTTLEWHNSNLADKVPIVILLVYGHGLQNGSVVQGNNFVTPALEPLFRDMAKKLIREVK